jgi:hypothetical protein
MSDNLQRYRYLGKSLPASSGKRLVVLTGARQTGKTTLSKGKYPDLQYINMDAPENRCVLLSNAFRNGDGSTCTNRARFYRVGN